MRSILTVAFLFIISLNAFSQDKDDSIKATDLMNGAFTIAGAVIGVLLQLLVSKKDRVKKNEEITQLKRDNRQIEKQLEITKKVLPKDIEIIDDVDDVLQNKVLPIIRLKAKGREPIKIINFGLDLYSVMPWIKNKIIHPTEFDNATVEIKSLIIDDNSQYLRNYINGSSNISTEAINSSIKIAREIEKMDDCTKFSLEIRQYFLPPIYHGFIINEEHLFLGFTEIENGKIVGGIKPYLHLIKGAHEYSEFTEHYFTFFKDWFYFYWNRSEPIVDVKK